MATGSADSSEDVGGIGGAVVAVLLGNSRIGLVSEPKVGDQHARAAGGKRTRGRRTDTVVPTCYEGDVTAQIEES